MSLACSLNSTLQIFLVAVLGGSEKMKNFGTLKPAREARQCWRSSSLDGWPPFLNSMNAQGTSPHDHQVLQRQLRCSPEGVYATLLLSQDLKCSINQKWWCLSSCHEFRNFHLDELQEYPLYEIHHGERLLKCPLGYDNSLRSTYCPIKRSPH